MPSPTRATISKLYCVSGNQCAYPGCTTPLLDPGSNVLIAEVCHIRADQPMGPRYDPSQTDAERHAFENLIIMCCNHHKVIDSDLKTWTVERLTVLKRAHETRAIPLLDVPSALVDQLLITISVTTGQVNEGSVITTINQSGGQVAHQIINNGEPRRQIPAQQLEALISRLGQYPRDTFFIMAPRGYGEAHRLGEMLYRTFKQAEWTTESDGVAEFWPNGPVSPGISLLTVQDRPSLKAIVSWCAETGLQPSVYVGPLPPIYWPDLLNILVGPAPE